MVNCIESGTCFPTNPTDIFSLYDTFFGTGTSIIMLGLLLGIITVAVYVRNRSLPMLTVLGFYEVAVFGSIVTSQYVSSQYHVMLYVLIFGAASGGVFMILRLVKE